MRRMGISNKGFLRIAQILEGGKADEQGVSSGEVDQNELEMGMKVELEHTPDENLAKEIAMDHLTEIPDYYTRLKKMEEQALKELSQGNKQNTEDPSEDLKDEE